MQQQKPAEHSTIHHLQKPYSTRKVQINHLPFTNTLPLSRPPWHIPSESLTNNNYISASSSRRSRDAISAIGITKIPSAKIPSPRSRESRYAFTLDVAAKQSQQLPPSPSLKRVVQVRSKWRCKQEAECEY